MRGSRERNACGTVRHQLGSLCSSREHRGSSRRSPPGAQNVLVARTSKRRSGPSGKNASGRTASAWESGSSWVVERPAAPARSVKSGSVGVEGDGRARRAWVARPSPLALGGRREAADRLPGRATEDLVDEVLVVDREIVARGARPRAGQELGTTAEAQEGRHARTNRPRELPHPSEASAAQGIPVPALRDRRVGARLGRIVPVVRAAEHGDRGRVALREQRGVELRVIALDRLQRLSRPIVRATSNASGWPPRMRAIEVVAAERRKEGDETPLQELRVAGVVHELSTGRKARLAGRIGVHAQDPGSSEDRPRVVGAVRGDLADDRDGVGSRVGPRRPSLLTIASRSARMGLGSAIDTSRRRSGRIGPVGPDRLARDALETNAVFARLERVMDRPPRDPVTATGRARGTLVASKPRTSRTRSIGAGSGRSTRRVQCSLTRRADPAARVRPIDGIGGGRAGTRPVVARHAVAQHVAGALDRADVAEHRRPRVRRRDDQPKPARAGVHEPGAPGRLRGRDRPDGGLLVRFREGRPAVNGARGRAIARLAVGSGSEDLPPEPGRYADRRRLPPKNPDDTEMGRPYERCGPGPRLRAGRARTTPCRSSRRRPSARPFGGIGRADGDQVAVTQRVEHGRSDLSAGRTPRVRSRLGGLERPEERDGQDGRDENERRTGGCHLEGCSAHRCARSRYSRAAETPHPARLFPRARSPAKRAAVGCRLRPLGGHEARFLRGLRQAKSRISERKEAHPWLPFTR